jgi:hypothetical protein
LFCLLALLALSPSQKLLKQLLAVRHAGGRIALEEPVERIPKRVIFVWMLLEPAHCRSKSLPAGELLGQVHLSPFGVMSVAAKFGKA